MMLARPLALGLITAVAAPAFAQEPMDQAEAITQALSWFCSDWVRPGASDAPQPRHEEGRKAGWLEQRSAAPAVGPILVKGGDWGRANLVRVVQPTGHRCSVTLQLSRAGWTTDTAHAAVTAWAIKTWPNAEQTKSRGPGPRASRETVWQVEPALSLTLQESPEAGAQPNVFITLARVSRDGKAI